MFGAASSMIIWVYGRILLIVIAFILLFWLVDRMQVNRERKRIRAQKKALHEAIERERNYGDEFWAHYEEDYRREFN